MIRHDVDNETSINPSKRKVHVAISGRENKDENSHEPEPKHGWNKAPICMVTHPGNETTVDLNVVDVRHILR